MKVILYILLFLFSTNFYAMDYINKYLPEDSLIRKIHNSEPRKTGLFGLDSSMRKACDRLNITYSNIASKNGLRSDHAFSCLFEDANEILANQPQDTKQNELDLIFILQHHFKTNDVDFNWRRQYTFSDSFWDS